MASSAKTKIRFLTYNVWSREHVAVYRRIRAISELVEQHDPDVIFLQVILSFLFDFNVFPRVYSRLSALIGNQIIAMHLLFPIDPTALLQEVTEYIHNLFQEAPWWTLYKTFSSKDKKHLQEPQLKECLMVKF
jgi:hypothetical protein